MSEELSQIQPAGEAQPLQVIPIKPKRGKRSFIRHNYAKVWTIREADKDRVGQRITKIPDSLESARARQLIIMTKLLDRMERKLNLMEDMDAQVTTREYKDLVEAVERCQEMAERAFGVGVEDVKKSAQPVNNGIIVHGAQSEDISRLLSKVSAAATHKPVIDLAENDAGTARPNS